MTHITSKVGIILACMVLIIIAGMVIDVTPAMLILIPIMMPVIRQYGINPIAFGVASTLLFSQGLLTPPVGQVLFVGSSISGLSVERLTKALLPQMAFMVIALILITLIPSVTMWLPTVLGYI